MIATSEFRDLRGPYDVVIADPPWKYQSNSVARPGRNAMRHYPCMSDDDICALPVKTIVSPDSLLLLWTTSPMLVRSLEVVTEWGFEYKSQLVWIKERIGLGHWARNRHEIVLICRRGKFPCRRPSLFPTSTIVGGQTTHSRKPRQLHWVIGTRFPEAKKLELFARQPEHGWDVWGNETNKYGDI